jgi:hypothetical protein
MADRWNERDTEFADQLRVKARQTGRAEDKQAVRRLIQKAPNSSIPKKLPSMPVR